MSCRFLMKSFSSMRFINVFVAFISIWQGCRGQIVMDPDITIPYTVPVSDGMRVRGTIAEDVTLTCQVENAPEQLNVRWQRTTFKENFEELQTIPIASDMDSEDINKWSIEKPTPFSWRLRIKALQLEDEGNYTCYIELTIETRVSMNRTVLVTAPPLLIEGMTSTDTSGDEGEVLTLTCNATGRPLPTIYWRREGDALLPGGGVVRISNNLRIERLEYTHQGRYFCQAVNEVGEDHREIILSVNYAPKLSPESQNGYGQALGYKRTLSCLVDANPKPNFDFDSSQLAWIRDNAAVPLDERVYTRVIQGAYNRLTFELVFHEVQAGDFDTYTCRASNNFGQANMEVQLYETDSPQPDKGIITSSAPLLSMASLHLLSISCLICFFTFSRFHLPLH